MNSCILAIGTNKGNRLLNIDNALAFISEIIGVITSCSSVIEFPPLLLCDSPAEWNLLFLNLVLLVQTDYSFFEVFSLIKSIEIKMGRDLLSPMWSPRIIDIDLIAYNNLIYSCEKLIVPHSQMYKRLFVLEPLAEILPNGVHPIFQKTFKQLYDQLKNP